MGVTVAGVNAVEILDSRGNPTLAVTVTLGDGTIARAGVPSGASTGSAKQSSSATATRPATGARVFSVPSGLSMARSPTPSRARPSPTWRSWTTS